MNTPRSYGNITFPLMESSCILFIKTPKKQGFITFQLFCCLGHWDEDQKRIKVIHSCVACWLCNNHRRIMKFFGVAHSCDSVFFLFRISCRVLLKGTYRDVSNQHLVFLLKKKIKALSLLFNYFVW